jgi:hypothetical protein
MRYPPSGPGLEMSWRLRRCIGFRRFDQMAVRMCTGPDERKAKNLSVNCHCLDLVIEGTAEGVSDHAELGRVADTYESKYGAHFVAPDATWSGLRPASDLAQEDRSAKHAGASRHHQPRTVARSVSRNRLKYCVHAH